MKKETEKIKKALKLIENEGFSFKKAAERVGLHWATVQRWAKKEGVLSPRAKKLLATKLKKIDQERKIQIPHTEDVEEIKLTLWQRIKIYLGFE